MSDRKQLFSFSLIATVALLLSLIQLMPTAIQMVTGVRIVRAEMMIIEDRAGDPRIMLTEMGDDAPRIMLWDADENVRAELALTPLGFPGLSLMSKEGRTVAKISTHTPSEQPEISIHAAQGRPRWRVHLDPDGTPSVVTVLEPE